MGNEICSGALIVRPSVVFPISGVGTIGIRSPEDWTHFRTMTLILALICNTCLLHTYLQIELLMRD